MKGLRELLSIALCLSLLSGCAASTHKTAQSKLGRPISSSEMEALLDKPGPVELATIKSADWAASLDGLLNLKNPKAKKAGLKNKEEPIQLYVHLLNHPQFGLYLIDTGISQKLVNDPGAEGISWLVKKGMQFEKMLFNQDIAEALNKKKSTLKGVFMTHLHIDHILGMAEISNEAPIYTGPKEVENKKWINFVTQGTTDRLLKGKGPIQEYKFMPDQDAKFEGILDLLGDGSVFAILSPGHTPGSVAYIVRTTSGAVLLTGDTCITRWGWENEVEPGSFTIDHNHNRKSLLALKALSLRHPKMLVKLGHQ